MAWDSTRPVPWQRLMREWLVYAALMAVLFVLFFSDQNLIGILAGLFVSGPLFLAFGYVMAKFGYQRKSLKDLRTATATPRNDAGSGKNRKKNTADDDPADAPRPKPAPTKRTGGGTRPSGSGRKRRR